MATTDISQAPLIDLEDQPASPAGRLGLDHLATAVHELRGPITLVVGCGETLHEMWGRPELQTHGPVLLETMVAAGRRLRRLIDDVLTAACMEHGTVPLRLEPTPIRPVVQLARGDLGPAAPPVEVDCPPDLCARADPDRLEQILVNLLANAMQHGVPPIVVESAAAPDAHVVDIFVRDAGPGIDAADRDHLFVPFTPLASPSATSTGIGLSIARTLARAMGGDLTYTNDEASTFRLQLPLEDGSS